VDFCAGGIVKVTVAFTACGAAADVGAITGAADDPPPPPEHPAETVAATSAATKRNFIGDKSFNRKQMRSTRPRSLIISGVLRRRPQYLVGAF
jgi:hypothetical protein